MKSNGSLLSVAFVIFLDILYPNVILPLNNLRNLSESETNSEKTHPAQKGRLDGSCKQVKDKVPGAAASPISKTESSKDSGLPSKDKSPKVSPPKKGVKSIPSLQVFNSFGNVEAELEDECSEEDYEEEVFLEDDILLSDLIDSKSAIKQKLNAKLQTLRKARGKGIKPD